MIVEAPPAAGKTIVLDDLDLQLLHALQIDGRIGFRRLAEVLGVSDQTIARRYRRLRSSAGLRITGQSDACRIGCDFWLVRLNCAPDSAAKIADALGRRPDTSFVMLTSGGSEIVCATHPRTSDERDALLLRKLPDTPRLLAMTAHCVLHRFYGGPLGWYSKVQALDGDQIVALQPPASDTTPQIQLDATDEILLHELARDGRISYADLQAATGRTESSVKRRVEHLRRTGALYFDVEVDPTYLGYKVMTMLWLKVAPQRLSAIGAAISAHPQVSFAAAVTGPSNLAAAVICRNMADLYEYLEGRIGSIEGVQSVESAPVMRQVKRLPMPE